MTAAGGSARLVGVRIFRVLLVDDHALFVEALAARLSREPDLEVLPVAHDERSAYAMLSTAAPAVVVLDVALGADSGLEVLDRVTAQHPGVRVVMLTGSTSPELVVEAVRRGASAWLPKTCGGDQLISVIRGVIRGESWIPPELLGAVLRQLAEPVNVPQPDPLGILTAREREVLQCMVDGLNRSDIARQLFVSANTVRTHTQNLLAKLHVHSVLEAASFALRSGMRHSSAHESVTRVTGGSGVASVS
jgi:DNA-binding NarL/FixJ family response regulator